MIAHIALEALGIEYTPAAVLAVRILSVALIANTPRMIKDISGIASGNVATPAVVLTWF